MRRAALLAFAVAACAPAREGQPKAAAGDSLYVAGDYDAARAAYRAELQRGNPSGTARAHLLTSIGLAAYHLGDYDEARRVTDSALAIQQIAGASAPESFRTHNAMGLVAWNQGRLAAADTLLRTALRFANEAHDTLAIAKASANIGLVLTEYGEFDAARVSFAAAHEAAHAVGDARTEGNALTNLGMLALRFGDIATAEQNVRDALRVYEAARFETGTQNALGQMATIEAAKGDAQAAFAYVDSALAIVRRQGLKQEEASDLQILGDLYADAGDLRDAALYYGRAEREFAASGIQLEAGNLMRARAQLDAAMGDTTSARTRAADALAIHQQLQAHAQELSDRLTIIDLAPANRADLGAELDRADSLARTFGSAAVAGHAALARARYLERRGRPREVLASLAGPAALSDRLDNAIAWEAAALRSRAWTRLGQLDSAEAQGRAAIRLVERARGAYGSAELRTTYTARLAQVYTDLVLVLLREGKTASAFEIADAARGRALVEHLASARAQLAGTTAPASFVDAEALATRIDSLVTRLEASERRAPRERGVEWESTRRDLVDQLARVRAEYEAKLARAGSGDDAELLGLTTVDASRVRATLAPNEALLDYLLTRDSLLTFVVTRGGVQVVGVPIDENALTARSRVMRSLIGARTTIARAVPAAEGLFDLLIAPVERLGALRGVDRLVIVPHGALAYLPFAALVDRQSGKSLIERYVLEYAPSAASLPVLRARSSGVQQAADARLAVALAPFTRELPASAAEVRRFANRVAGSTMRVDRDATESELRAALESGGIVHVATHAELNTRNPMFSEIRLAADVRARGQRDDDGRLYVYEVFGLRVRSPLVFLSGCETGAGSAWSTDFERGEDYATLARAFLFAGARNVIATLWPIEDDGAAELADRFYDHLRGSDAAQALATAQREMIRDERYRAPFYWAGYELSGAGR